ncbi:hypothetical protein B0I35DRAFT_271105 [Stachybotrys elegans]|uniref:Uncharacterized protein n=1 Tax=Stachybotrys elegans TaxID=80388 RepID=A0A8K0WNU4_9HYPO|nr:hypothetical protein B0I35DRAFT_271105 [Stachybotrys elegans]
MLYKPHYYATTDTCQRKGRSGSHYEPRSAPNEHWENHPNEQDVLGCVPFGYRHPATNIFEARLPACLPACICSSPSQQKGRLMNPNHTRCGMHMNVDPHAIITPVPHPSLPLPLPLPLSLPLLLPPLSALCASKLFSLPLHWCKPHILGVSNLAFPWRAATPCRRPAPSPPGLGAVKPNTSTVLKHRETRTRAGTITVDESQRLCLADRSYHPSCLP